ncbi:MAG: hypothetical protein R8M38_08525 [Mariprofundaceae bacterium]
MKPMINTVFAIIICFSLLPTAAIAKKVYSPFVEVGVFELETQNEVFNSKDPKKDGARKHQLEVSYGVNEHWHTGIYAVYEKSHGGSLTYTQSKWANIIQLSKPGENWLDFGLYAEYIWYAANSKKADILELKALLQKPVGKWKHTLNLVFKQPLWGDETSTEFGYAWRSQYNLNADLKPAIEIYGALGTVNDPQLNNQSLLIGPVLEYKVTENIEIDFGWLMDAHEGFTYGDFKLNMEFEW